MNPLKRKSASKRKGAKTFKRHVAHTKSINIKGAPMRGGIRL